ncbi:MAG: AMP-binding protein [Phycisphaerae bacterium]
MTAHNTTNHAPPASEPRLSRSGRGDDHLWDRSIETMSPAELHDRLEVPRLRRQLIHTFDNSPFWRDRFDTAGITRGDLDNGIDFESFPFTEKRELLLDQVNHPPYGRLPAVSHDDIRRVHRTSGTASRPFFTLLTGRDVETTVEAGARAFWCAGLRPADTVVHCLSYCLWSGGVTDHLCLERTGATVIPYGVGNSRYLLELIQTLKPTAISCTPSYLERLAELLVNEMGVTPASLSLRKGLFGGEPGVSDPNFRSAIERQWGIQAVDANYGMSDVLSIFGSECRYRSGLHFHGAGILLPELIDPSTMHAVPIQGGARGELVLTHLMRQAQPLIRFRTGDVVRILAVGDCHCGRSGFRFAVLGRCDDMIVVKGVNLFPHAFRDVLARFSDRLTGAYRVVLDDQMPRRFVRLRVEVRSSVEDHRRAELARTVERSIRDTLQVQARITWAQEGSLGRNQGKTQLTETAV